MYLMSIQLITLYASLCWLAVAQNSLRGTCLAPSGIPHATSPSCRQGASRTYGQRCRPSCETGYYPTVEEFICTPGGWEPSTFACFKRCLFSGNMNNAVPDVPFKDGSRNLKHGEVRTPNCQDGYVSDKSAISCNDGVLKPSSTYACVPAITTTSVTHPTTASSVMTSTGVKSGTTTASVPCMRRCARNRQSWSRKCTWRRCSRCAECMMSTTRLTSGTKSAMTSTSTTTPFAMTSTSVTISTTPATGRCESWCATKPASWAEKCTWDGKDCSACPTCDKLRPPGFKCASWCHTSTNPWGQKCSWNFPGECSGCRACGPTPPKPAKTEFPDPVNMSYEAWQCQKICQTRSELLNGSGKGCCTLTSIGKCQFTTNGFVDSNSFLRGSTTWDCEPNPFGPGECKGWQKDKMCNGGPAKPALQMIPAGIPQAPPKNLVLDWSDEFDTCVAGKPDPSIWSFDFEPQQGRVQWYTDKNAECIDGKLVIKARKESPVEVGYDYYAFRGGTSINRVHAAFFEYTSSALTTKGKKNFVLGGRGKAELRARVDVRSGGFPSWWIMGEPDDFKPRCDWPGCGEIDMMEYTGETGWMNTNFCVPHGGDAACSWGSTHCECKWSNVQKAVDEEWAMDFHTWTFEWDEGSDIMKVLVDGVLFNSLTFSLADPDVTGRPVNPYRGKRQYMILNLALGFVGGDPTPTTFPMNLEVDYVRVYKEV